MLFFPDGTECGVIPARGHPLGGLRGWLPVVESAPVTHAEGTPLRSPVLCFKKLL
jgi:hypothetical protein